MQSVGIKFIITTTNSVELGLWASFCDEFTSYIVCNVSVWRSSWLPEGRGLPGEFFLLFVIRGKSRSALTVGWQDCCL